MEDERREEELREAAESTAEEVKASGEAEGASGEQEHGAETSGTENEAEAQTEKSAKPSPEQQKIEELTDKYKRLFAEFDNYRKRTDAEKSGMYAEGQRNVLEKILPIVDNFERAVQNVPEELCGCAYADGVEKVYRSCMDILKGLGVEPIEAVGQPFDANLHNAVMHVEDENCGENEIVEEFRKGYRFRDRILRYSMVKVAN